MKSPEEIKQVARSLIRKEAETIKSLEHILSDDFVKSVQHIYTSDGRVIITGIGKSANIGLKIVATLNSTGTPAIFMHAADAIHGDLGIIQKQDIVIAISNSGITPEIKVLIPMLKSMGNKLIALTATSESFLAENADFVINTGVTSEACQNNLVPTSSTTAQLVMGDAIAIALLEMRGFTEEDFARLHPGGAIGKKIYLKVGDLSAHNKKPLVDISTDIKKIIIEISSKRLGVTGVLKDKKLIGIITDGDLRRMLQKNISIEGLIASDIMTENPRTIEENTLVVDALEVMRKNNITQLLVTKQNEYVGVIHLHDILKEGFI